MAKRAKSSVGWANLKATLKNCPAPGLIALLQELYELDGVNRTFLHARLLPDKPEVAIDESKKKLRQILSVNSAFDGHFKHSDAKRVIDQFAKASDDAVNLADFLLSDLEMSFETLGEIGDFVPMVDHIYIALNRLDEIKADLPDEAMGPILQRIGDLARRWDGKFGYGLSDELRGFAQTWKEAR
jgi:hypothetical protein